MIWRHLLIGLTFLSAVSPALDGASARTAPLAAAWERSLSTLSESRDYHLILSTRRLVDDSVLVVVQEGFGASATRYGAGGVVLSTASFPRPDLTKSATTDPFGSVVLLNSAGVVKYNGLTGRRLWLAQPPFSPSVAAIAPSGHVFVAGSVYGAAGSVSWATLCYEGRTGKVLWGPVVYQDSRTQPLFPPPAGPVDLAVDTAGDLVVTGSAAQSEGSLWAAIKYRGTTGEQLWGPLRLGVVSSAPPPTVCPGSCLYPATAAKGAFDRKGNLFLAVSTFTGPYAEGWLTAKYDGLTGKLLWGPVPYKGESDIELPSVIGVNGNGNVVVGGSANRSQELIKYSGETGARTWGPIPVPSTVSALAFDGGGQVVVTGLTSVSDYPQRTIWSTSMFDGRSGARLWTESVGSPDSNYFSPSYVAIGSDGNITSFASAYVGSGTSQHPELKSVNYSGGTGSTVWGPVSTRSQGARTYPLSLVVGRGGETVLVASSGVQPVSIVKYASDGRNLWGPVQLSAEEPDYGWPTAAVLDPNEDVIAVGGKTVSKYSGANGALLWGPVRVENLYYPLAAGTTNLAGDVLLTGRSDLGWETVKLSGMTGATIWTSVYRPSNGAAPTDVVADRNGDVFVTGALYPRNDYSVWVTFKYNGATGDPIWGPVVFDHQVYGSDSPKKLALDDSGNVIVTGFSSSSRGRFWYTIKYSGSTGQVLWGPVAERIYSDYAPTALVLDQTGDVFVIGARVGDSGAQTVSWSTIKYSGRTGELVWGPKEFPAPADVGTSSIMIDSKGNPVVAGTIKSSTIGSWMLVGYDSQSGNVVLGPEIYDTGNDDRISQIKAAGADWIVSGASEGLARTVRYSERLGIATFQKDLGPAPVLCGDSFLRQFTSSNGTPPILWEVSAGDLPPGIGLDPFSGSLSGAASRSGGFSFVVRARDATGATAERGFVIDVLDVGPYAAIDAVPVDGCVGGGYILTVPGTYASYNWSPGGETTPAIAVCPTQPTLYSVVLSEPGGCERRASIELQPFRIELVPRLPLVPPERKRPNLPSPRPR